MGTFGCGGDRDQARDRHPVSLAHLYSRLSKRPTAISTRLPVGLKSGSMASMLARPRDFGSSLSIVFWTAGSHTMYATPLTALATLAFVEGHVSKLIESNANALKKVWDELAASPETVALFIKRRSHTQQNRVLRRKFRLVQ